MPDGKRFVFLRRTTQTSSLALFLVLLFSANIHFFGLPKDIFLRLDPLAGTLLPVASRSWLWGFWPAMLVMAATIICGRFFCGWLCPMGATLDAAGGLLRRFFPVRQRLSRFMHTSAYFLKYLVLAFMGCAAFCGVNLIFWGSPIALLTRFYGLFLAPALHAASNFLLAISEPLLRELDADSILYALEEPHFFHTSAFVACFWGVLLILELIAPRFWCRYLCPAGALLGALSLFSRFRRGVLLPKCAHCGQCVKNCPTGIINPKNLSSPAQECIVCGSCLASCKFGATGFSRFPAHPSPAMESFLPSRRAFVTAGIGGVIVGMALPVVSAKASPQQYVRPPGTIPEDDFLAVCLRCGECMKVCPTGGLQPIGLESVFSGIFSPRLDPYSGGCLPECTACGNVCPSHAILPLVFAQKRYAKIGTAVIDRKECLAWGEDRRCMVCKENCPWNAVEVVPRPGYAVPVPKVRSEHCYGCGFCQKACPKTPAAIVVESTGALRLNSPDFEKAARAAGLRLQPASEISAQALPNQESPALPPGFLE